MLTILKTFGILLALENAINVNVILNGIRHIPVIGKHIPEKIHSIKIFKIYATVVSVIYAIVKALFAKIFMFASVFLLSMVSTNFKPDSSRTAYILIFLVFSLIAVAAFNAFRITTAGEYAVFHMGMDAAKYVRSNIFYQIVKIFIGYTLFGIPTALLAGVPWPVAILIPFSGMGFISVTFGIKMSLYAFSRSVFKKERKKLSRGKLELRILLNAFVLFVFCISAFVVTPFLIYYDFYSFGVITVIIAALLFVPGILLIRRFPYTLYRTALSGEREKDELVKETNRRSYRKKSKLPLDQPSDVKFDAQRDLKNNTHGYRYLNELFLKRHSRALFFRFIWIILMTVTGIALASLFLRAELKYTSEPDEFITRLFFVSDPAFFPLILLFTNFGMFMSEVMYKSCDSALLKFSFYRKQEALREMYRLRVVSVIKYNLPLTILIAIFSIVVGVLTGGEDYPFQCVWNILVIFASMAFYSIRLMTLHYLMQPFEENVKNLKAVFYYLFGFVSFGFWLIILIFRVPAYILAPFLILLAAGYSFISDKLIYKFAAKVFH